MFIYPNMFKIWFNEFNMFKMNMQFKMISLLIIFWTVVSTDYKIVCALSIKSLAIVLNDPFTFEFMNVIKQYWGYIITCATHLNVHIETKWWAHRLSVNLWKQNLSHIDTAVCIAILIILYIDNFSFSVIRLNRFGLRFDTNYVINFSF